MAEAKEYFDIEHFLCSREEFVKKAQSNVMTPFAIVKDSKWYEKGEMGWWATVFNPKEEEVWQNEAADIINSLPDDTLITVVDCHI